MQEEKNIKYNHVKYSHPSLISFFSKTNCSKTKVGLDEERPIKYFVYEWNTIKKYSNKIHEAILEDKDTYFWDIKQKTLPINKNLSIRLR